MLRRIVSDRAEKASKKAELGPAGPSLLPVCLWIADNLALDLDLGQVLSAHSRLLSLVLAGAHRDHQYAFSPEVVSRILWAASLARPQMKPLA